MNICFSVHNPSLRYTITTTTKHFIPKQVGVGNGEHFHVTDILLFCKNFVACHYCGMFIGSKICSSFND
jgi:hypothetical protein